MLYVITALCTLAVLAQVATLLLVARHSHRLSSTVREESARLRHELAMDCAIFVGRLRSPEGAAAWVRRHVDPEAQRFLAARMGPDYERYLLDLHGRYMARAS